MRDLHLELAALREEDFDLELLGFGRRGIDALVLSNEPIARRYRAGPTEQPRFPKRAICGFVGRTGYCAPTLLTKTRYRACVANKAQSEWRRILHTASGTTRLAIDVDGGGRNALGKVQKDDTVDWSPALRLFTGDVPTLARRHPCWRGRGGLNSIGFQISRAR